MSASLTRGEIAALALQLDAAMCDGHCVPQLSSTHALNILGNPLRALSAASRLAAASGVTWKAGSIVLAGAATSAEPILPGAMVRATLAGVGEVSFSAISA